MVDLHYPCCAPAFHAAATVGVEHLNAHLFPGSTLEKVLLCGPDSRHAAFPLLDPRLKCTIVQVFQPHT